MDVHLQALLIRPSGFGPEKTEWRFAESDTISGRLEAKNENHQKLGGFVITAKKYVITKFILLWILRNHR
jgi:hypothetical protein